MKAETTAQTRPEVNRTPSRFRHPIGKYRVLRSNACIACGKCAKLCPFEAIELDEAAKKAVVRLDACYGCGTCRVACPTEALSLTPRADVPAVANDW